ncbi:putative fatty acyl-CoA reductase [Lucilia cuprina]|uniref:Fatty acyl-CoA reductase n=1 Tax=Lucilia cuprina TaxID=7375 RepID=A0A0L0CAW3_LUCCU|nr:putative fatty acyl-CoA reductase CG5065 [Lucilia cuprina]KAI8128070.1 putative fatty acyl-CoA reductase [Lucilia cuprina]KNC28614.1 putative fatty acyl-CoA reductase [Lucilia cuprina]
MSITKFYENQEIFITGGSGFIGNVLIEKLIRSFPNFAKMYILIRNKKGKSVDERLQEVLNKSVFDRARKEQPQAFSKIIPIAGDCQELELGISREDLEKLKNVNLIFHSAASVRFDDYLRSAILLNTRGTHELVKLATKFKQLKAFVHISTSYSNPDKHVVEERIYPAYADWRTTIKLAETYDVETLNILFSKYSSDQPNTYTFTKSLAEHIINDYRHQLPIMVYRPSIVVSTIEEPIPGWVDNFNGPIGMLVACGVGILRTSYADPDITADVIPVDVTVRALLIAAFNLATRQTIPRDELEVINCANATINSINYGTVIRLGKICIKKNPFEKCLWLPEGSITRCAVWHYLRLFTVQIGLALIVDALLRLAKQKPFLLKLQRRICAANSALYVFMTTEWMFCNEKFKNLENLIPLEEKEKLSFMCYSDFDHEKFISHGIKGAKQFLLKESPEASNQAKMRLKIFLVLHYLIQFIGVFLIGKMLIRYLKTYF